MTEELIISKTYNSFVDTATYGVQKKKKGVKLRFSKPCKKNKQTRFIFVFKF